MRRFFSLLLMVCAMSLATVEGAPIPSTAESVDWLINGRYVVTMDGTHRVIPDGAIAIRGNQIVGVGPHGELATHFNAKHVLSKPDAILTPGLIDTHTHAPMSLFRGIADDMRLEDWLHNFIFPAESKNVTAEFVRWGTRLACLEMLQSGITTYTDMYYFEEVEAETAKAAGVRGVLGQSVIGLPAPDYKTWNEAVGGAEAFIKRYEHDQLITPAVAPHAIYTTPDEALVAAHKLAVKYNVPLLIHLAETERERDDARTKRNSSPTQVLDQLGILNGRVLAAHAIWESDEDLALLKSHGTGVAHCPSSNTKLASGVARVSEMLKLGIPVGLGTDGFAGSNDTADLLAEMNLAAKLQKVFTRDPTALSAEQVMNMATAGGARALGLEKEIGSIEVGKRADLIAISLNRANAHPLYNVYSFLAYAVKAGDVEDVFINGRQVVADRKVLTLNAAEIYRKAGEYRQQIVSSLTQR